MTATTPEAVRALAALLRSLHTDDDTVERAMEDAAATLLALLAERDAAVRERDDERVALNRAIELRDQVIARRGEQLDAAAAEGVAARAEAQRMREALLSARGALIAHEAYMSAQGYSGPDDEALHPKAAKNWRNVRAAIRATGAALAKEPGRELPLYVKVTSAVPDGEVRLVDPDTNQTLGRIVNLKEPGHD